MLFAMTPQQIQDAANIVTIATGIVLAVRFLARLAISAFKKLAVRISGLEALQKKPAAPISTARKLAAA